MAAVSKEILHSVAIWRVFGIITTNYQGRQKRPEPGSLGRFDEMATRDGVAIVDSIISGVSQTSDRIGHVLRLKGYQIGGLFL